ncbi:MAG: hypothetical protein OSB70_03870 [Myxococcota bacterium]|nr:hypothetical protein [Myxococcota bacterium]
MDRKELTTRVPGGRDRARGRSSRSEDSAGAKRTLDSPGWSRVDSSSVADELAIDPEELLEFAAPEHEGNQADPQFKARLRETLWELVEKRYGKATDDSREDD